MKILSKFISVIFVLAFTLSHAFAADVYLYVTRHGKTMFNTAHRVQGWSDTPLTAPGIEVAKKLGKGLQGTDFIATYASDLGRARQTARVILEAKGDQVDIIEMPELRETCFGLFEGDLDPNMWAPAAKQLGYPSDNELMQDFANGNITIDKMMDAIKAVEQSGEAEGYQQVKTRMQNALTQIAKSAQEQGGGNVLVVSHGMAILAMINDMTDTPIHNQLGNASVTKIRYTDEGKFIVETIGDTSYINNAK
ncbi:putative phosphoglycerate mutase [Orbus hercynius]|uniref:Putative phosphoglycerate mutase n=1 Tax=Orbus hercynius TaxID=593135 RepID=A0A495RKS5_9GAMM|nr:histidine phosphatase family protein [Orbus hercynius]RKS87388.1 putative phosphoglycerate mutase [Orbus hercynius]